MPQADHRSFVVRMLRTDRMRSEPAVKELVTARTQRLHPIHREKGHILLDHMRRTLVAKRPEVDLSTAFALHVSMLRKNVMLRTVLVGSDTPDLLLSDSIWYIALVPDHDAVLSGSCS